MATLCSRDTSLAWSTWTFAEEHADWIVLEYRFGRSHAQLMGRDDDWMDEAGEHLLRCET